MATNLELDIKRGDIVMSLSCEASAGAGLDHVPSSTSQHESLLETGNISGDLSAKGNELTLIPTPHCHNMEEHPSATIERARLNNHHLRVQHQDQDDHESRHPILNATENVMLSSYLTHGLAYTIGSALTCLPPPSQDICLQAFLVTNKAGLTAGARAWSKHAHRSGNASIPDASPDSASDNLIKSLRWWGTPSGPVTRINERAVELFWRVWRDATWRNLHWLPHQVLVFEVRVPEGYGMRWARDRRDLESMSEAVRVLESGEAVAEEQTRVRSGSESDGGASTKDAVHNSDAPWVFRGFVEPMMENGHEVGWRH